ncbi:hypothetical protein BJ546DRAFT_371205 [Cryomyces antarcticus]|nr:hypothetical protein LTR04_001535 [Oleoguttula sp. CCFEE 6159]
MTDRNSPPPSGSPPSRRRASFAGQTFADLFGRKDSTGANAGPITTAAAQANRRRLSVTTLGLSGSPNQTSPFGSLRSRGESISSANSGSIDESAIEDHDTATTSQPTTPFARRMSFGARALRDVKTNTSGNVNGRASVNKAVSSPTAKGRGLSSYRIVTTRPSKAHRLIPESDTGGEGFNWSENLRNRAERSSIAGVSTGPSPPSHQRAKSVAVMEPPVREMPKVANVPDHFQERILKGDFYMD